MMAGDILIIGRDLARMDEREGSWPRDTEYNNTNNNDIQHKKQLNVTFGIMKLSIMAVMLGRVSFMLSVIYAVCHLC
jgi:hypothetical protein